MCKFLIKNVWGKSLYNSNHAGKWNSIVTKRNNTEAKWNITVANVGILPHEVVKEKEVDKDRR